MLTTIFLDGDVQAVRIPAKLAFDPGGLQVEIERVEDELRIRLKRRSLGGVLEKFARFGSGVSQKGRGH